MNNKVYYGFEILYGKSNKTYVEILIQNILPIYDTYMCM